MWAKNACFRQALSPMKMFIKRLYGFYQLYYLSWKEDQNVDPAYGPYHGDRLESTEKIRSWTSKIPYILVGKQIVFFSSYLSWFPLCYTVAFSFVCTF